MAPPYYQITTKSAYDNAFRHENMKSLQNMGLSGSTLSGSDFTRTHLFALVVAMSTPTMYLPCYRNASTRNLEDFNGQVAAFTSERDSSTETNVLEHQLVRQYGMALGSVWSALENITKRQSETSQSDTESGGEVSGRPKRNISQVSFSVGSGSVSSSSSEGQQSISTDSSYTPNTSIKDLCNEEISHHLLVCALRLILHNTQSQSSDTAVEIRMRQRLTLELGSIKFVAEDDGGLHLRRANKGILPDNVIACFEAKRDLSVDRNNNPIISDNALAQMAYEAIVVSGNFGNQNVVIIHIARHHVCFLEFQISPAYMSQLKNGQTPDVPLKVVATRMFNLDTRNGRKAFAENLKRLISYSLAN